MLKGKKVAGSLSKRGCTWCVHSQLEGSLGQKRRLRLLEKEVLDQGERRRGAGPWIGVIPCKWPPRLSSQQQIRKLTHRARQISHRIAELGFDMDDSDCRILDRSGSMWRAQHPEHKQRLAYSRQGGRTLWNQ